MLQHRSEKKPDNIVENRPCGGAASPATLFAAMGIVDRGGGHPAMLLNSPSVSVRGAFEEIAAGIAADEDSLT